MTSIRYLAFAFVVAAGLPAGPAFANVCQAGKLMCATTMPVGGYCECRSHGQTEGGTAVSRPETREPLNSSAGGCGAHPNNPGCH